MSLLLYKWLCRNYINNKCCGANATCKNLATVNRLFFFLRENPTGDHVVHTSNFRCSKNMRQLAFTHSSDSVSKSLTSYSTWFGKFAPVLIE